MKASLLIMMLFVTVGTISYAAEIKNQDTLFSITIVEDGFKMSFAETKRGANYSVVKVSHIEGPSVATSMFIFKGSYEIAKLRNSAYFFKSKEWKDVKGDWFYKVYFLNDKRKTLKQLLGNDYSKDAQQLFDELGYISVDDLEMMFGTKK